MSRSGSPALQRFQHRHGRRVDLGMAQTDINRPPIPRLQQGCAGSVQNNGRFTRLAPDNFHIVPAEMFANARAERFGDRFLGGESGRDMARGQPMR